MGVFTVEVRATKPGRRPRSKTFRRVPVDSGSEMTWLPESDLRAVGVEVFKRDQLMRGSRRRVASAATTWC